jgi:ABC-type branched-subunit amino acid transport system substrate-binding protein
MKVKKLGYWILVLGLLAGFLVGCGATEEPTPVPEPTEEPVAEEPVAEEPAGEEVTMVIGFTTSQTGNYNVSSLRQVNGFLLWMNEVNDAGGVQLSDGTVVKFDYVTYDDESTTERVQELYTRLATEDNADLLISPYSSGLTAAASLIAEQYGKIIITTGAASDSNYKEGYTRVFQAYTPSSRYLTGAVDMLAHVDPDVKKVAFVYENDKFSTDVVNAAQEYAASEGYEIVLFEGYDSETKDFGPFIGPSQWEPLAAFTPESAAEAGLEWFGALGTDFVSAYEAAYDQEPSYHSMGGYVAGQILQKAVIDADSTDPEALKAAMDAMEMLTAYGHIKFDTSAEAHGLQIGHSMVYIQWQKDDAGNLVKQVVWPLEGKTADPIYPLP